MTTAVKCALIIGNDRYSRSPLESCINSAKDMSEALHLIGFHAKLKTDLAYMDMKIVTERFRKFIQSGAIVLFYFSGRGKEYDSNNYLMPIDYNGRNGSKIQKRYFNTSELIIDMYEQRPSLIIVVLDGAQSRQYPQSMPIPSVVVPASLKKEQEIIAPKYTPPPTIFAYTCANGASSIFTSEGKFN
ncbi:unnamed protein product, partial [Rotaria sp. Silwood1]